MNIHRVCGPPEISSHLADRGDHPLLYQFEGDRIEIHCRHWHSPTYGHLVTKTRFPNSSTTPSHPGGTTVVDPNSSTIAGPATRAPRPRFPRSQTGLA